MLPKWQSFLKSQHKAQLVSLRACSLSAGATSSATWRSC